MAELDPKLTGKQAKEKVLSAQNWQDLERIFYQYLGRKGQVNLLFKKLAELPDSEKKEWGKMVNDLQKEIRDSIDSRKKELLGSHSEKALKNDAEELGFVLPKIGHLHPITQTIRSLNNLFLEMGYSIMDGPEIESDEYCFLRLNVPQNHPARDMQDTIFIKEPQWLLRTHTSSIESRTLVNFKPPFKVVCPGKVYRNEKVTKSNHFVFYQYQGVVVMGKISLKDLFGTFNLLFQKLYGKNVKTRYRNKYYPEVEPGVGLDIQCFNCLGKGCLLCKGVGWIEMGGAGIIHPNLLEMAGINPKKWRGFAFGLGLDRWVMAKYKITDIRTLLGGALAYKYYEGENTLTPLGE